ncbi:hypothetical protein [Baia soyae]|uniref:Uncharacterized protein n=1 Tax=Baia soyae TaxID=1544746 RepID=A0A4R2RQZ9_9BACL|nr:hypothetical protein [Baia soyae]TCP65558.1 hypothetical protein EDD57_13241 [Baia soyae]
MKSKRFIAGMIACSAMLTGAELALPSFTHAADHTTPVSSSQSSTPKYTVVGNAITENYTLDKFSDHFAQFTATHSSMVRIRITTSQVDSSKKSFSSTWGFMRVDDTVATDKFLVPVAADRNIKNGETIEFFARVLPGKLYVFNALNWTGDQLNGIKPTPITGTITIDYIKNEGSNGVQ